MNRGDDTAPGRQIYVGGDSPMDGADQRNLLAAQADVGKTLMEKDASQYIGAAQSTLLAAQSDIGKTLMEKDPRK